MIEVEKECQGSEDLVEKYNYKTRISSKHNRLIILPSIPAY